MFTILASIVLAQAASAEAVQQQQTAIVTPAPCASEVHSEFDIWVGEWDVTPASGGDVVATSSIQRINNGCNILERWMPLGGTGGTSLSNVDPDTGRWVQNWMGSDGTPVRFEGGGVDGAMVLTGYWANYNGPGEDGLVRMRYSANDDGSVRQFGQVSFDHGLTWETGFDLIYRRRAE